MTHTQNYNLSQWEKTDRILMENFNSDNAAIDAALAAHAAALAKKGSCSIRLTTYTGTQDTSKPTPVSIDFGRKPLAFIIIGSGASMLGSQAAKYGYYFSGGAISTPTLNWSGGRLTFTVNCSTADLLNVRNVVYAVVAFYAEE